MRRPRYADVVATIALLLALTGSAYAVKVATRNSVTSKSIRNETITSKDVKNETLTGGDVKESTLDIDAPALAAGSVGSPEVKDDSLKGADIDESSLSLPAPPDPEPGLGVYSSRSSQDISIVVGDDGYLAPSGISPAPDAPDTVQMTSPDVDLVASDLYVEEPLLNGSSVPVTAQLLADGEVVLGCVLPQQPSGVSSVSCDSGTATGAIPAGSRLVVRFRVTVGSELVRAPMVSFAVQPA